MNESHGEMLDFDPASRRSNLKLLAALHHLLKPKIYFEIGIRWGDSLALSGDRTFALGVDPSPELRMDLPRRTWISERTSDDFFQRYGKLAKLLPRKVDLALIDGMHLSEYVLRDFINVEKIMAPGGVIVLDDTNPAEASWAERERVTGLWTGDVWKALAAFRRHRPDLQITTFDVKPAGLTIIRKLDPGNHRLADRYDDILQEIEAMEFSSDFTNDLGRTVQPYTPEALRAAFA